MRERIMGTQSSLFWLFSIVATLMVMMAATTVHAAPATIGGGIWTGAQNPDFTPQMTGNAPVVDAKVMVQDMHGHFVAYGAVVGNTWTASVPAPGEYLAMFSAPNHDATSREYIVGPLDASVMQDAYLPPLPHATANLLVYAFKDDYLNSEDDFPADPPLDGIVFVVYDEKGNEVARGVSGSQTPADLPLNMQRPEGLYYFRGLAPGDYEVKVDLSALPASPNGVGWIQNSTIEGGYGWEVSLYPGDPGTYMGAYLAWFSFVERLGQMPNAMVPTVPADSGTITGVLRDADGPFFNNPADPAFEPWAPTNSFVTPNFEMPNGLVVLWQAGIGAISVIEAAPDGTFTFNNVPPGSYKLFYEDVPLRYIWQETGVNVPPSTVVDMGPLYIPKWFGRVDGYVVDVTGFADISEPMIQDPPYLPSGGSVVDVTVPPPGTALSGIKVNMRLKDGSIWKTTMTDANGYYVFEDLPEVEVLGYVDAELPAGMHGKVVAENHNGVDYDFNMMGRTIQWYAANYRANIMAEAIAPVAGDIKGFVYNDSLDMGTWLPDGIYTEDEERTFHGVMLELWNADGTAPICQNDPVTGLPMIDPITGLCTAIVTAVSGESDLTALMNQGFLPLGITYPPDEFGGVFKGDVPGYYEFRGVAPGTYTVKMPLPAGFSASPLGSDAQVVTVAGGSSVTANFGMNTQVPLSGEIEGGVFDDLNVETNVWSILWDEKAPIDYNPVGIYDHFGYFLGVGYMGNDLCHPSSIYLADANVCPNGIEGPELEHHAAPGPHIYVGNDPTLWPADQGLRDRYAQYEPLPWTYNFGQGKYKFEADWSLLPISMIEILAPGQPVPNFGPLGNPLILPQEAPVITTVTVRDFGSVMPFALNGVPMLALSDGNGTIVDAGMLPTFEVAMLAPTLISNQPGSNRVMIIEGGNFGDAQGHSTVTLSGVQLRARSWSNGVVEVQLPSNSISGPLTVATPSGISNALPVDVLYTNAQRNYIEARSVFVDASVAVSGDGSKASPYRSISEAMDNLPAAKPNYVFVAPGTYNERIQIKTSNVNLIGSGPLDTVIDGISAMTFDPLGARNGGGPVIHIGDGEFGGVQNVMVSGFTITGGAVSYVGPGGGIFGDYGNDNIDINNNIIVQNGSEYGGGISLHYSNHNVKIWSNTIARNGNVGGYGGGISVADEPEYEFETTAEMVAEEFSLTHHTADDHNPGPPPGTYKIYNNLIFHNFSMDYGGGICLYELKDRALIYGNMIVENRSDDHGGGLFMEDTGPADIHSNVFFRNYVPDDGGAISLEDVGDDNATIRIYNNLLAENIADDRMENTAIGGAIGLDDALYVMIFNNTIVGNIVAGIYEPRGGAVGAERHGHEYENVAPGFSDAKIFGNIIWDNWRLQYDSPTAAPEGLDYSKGVNYRWTPDNLFVDNPAVNSPWNTTNNSESFSVVMYNVIDGGYTNGIDNVNADPGFVNPAGLDWHINSTSPAVDRAPNSSAPKIDLERNRRNTSNGRVDSGAYEALGQTTQVMPIPVSILGFVPMPVNDGGAATPPAGGTTGGAQSNVDPITSGGGFTASLNAPPVAEGGVDESIECLSLTCSVTLDGSGSTDPDGPGDITSYTWYENYGDSVNESILGTGVTLITSLSLSDHPITLVVEDTAGNTSSDTFTVSVNPANLSLFEIKKVEVEWDKSKIKVSGMVALPVGKTQFDVMPMGTANIALSGLGEIVNQAVTFNVKGKESKKWEYEGAGVEYKIDWKGVKFDYNQGISIKSNHIGESSTKLEIELNGTAGPLSIAVGDAVGGVVIDVDSAGAVTVNDPTVKLDVDDDGEIEVKLPFAMTSDMVIEVTGSLTTSINVADFLTAAVGKFEIESGFDAMGLVGTISPATFDVGVSLGEVGFAGSAQITDADWGDRKAKQWKHKRHKSH